MNKESSIIKKLMHGSVAMILTVVFVAAIVALNVFTTGLNNVHPMYIDMTSNQIFGITEETRQLLSEIDTPIEITFFMPKDKYEKTVYGGKMIVNCINTFASEFENITINEVEILKTPSVASEFTASEISSLATTAIAVRSRGKPRLLSNSAFFVTTTSGELYAFNGESAIVGAILQAISVDSPLVLFTEGHSEGLTEVQSQELMMLFYNSGFILDKIDLSTQDIPEEAKIIVICNPQKDFIGGTIDGDRGETGKLRTFLNDYGSVMYFSSPDVKALPELDDLLKSFGIEFRHNTKIVDYNNSLSSNKFNLSANYFVSGNSAGDELTASIRKLPTVPRTIVPNAKPITILNTAGERAVAPVLASFDTSKRIEVDESGAEKETAHGGDYLFVVAQKTRYVDNNPKTSLLLVSGSYDFLGYLSNKSYANSDILLNAMRITTTKKIATNIDYKLFDSNELNMNMDEQNAWTLISILLLPSIVAAAGITVWIIRRHS